MRKRSSAESRYCTIRPTVTCIYGPSLESGRPTLAVGRTIRGDSAQAFTSAASLAQLSFVTTASKCSMSNTTYRKITAINPCRGSSMPIALGKIISSHLPSAYVSTAVNTCTMRNWRPLSLVKSIPRIFMASPPRLPDRVRQFEAAQVNPLPPRRPVRLLQFQPQLAMPVHQPPRAFLVERRADEHNELGMQHLEI